MGTVKLIPLLVAVSVLHAGQSITLSSQTVSNSSITGCASNASCRLEFSLSGWSGTLGGNPITSTAGDFVVSWSSNSPPQMTIYSGHIAGGASPCVVDFTGRSLVTIRIERIAATSSTGAELCQSWDENGTLFTNHLIDYTSVTSIINPTGFFVGGTTPAVNIAYVRLYTTTVSAVAKPPTTAMDQTGMTFQWKFEGNLNDSVGSNNGALSGGSATYVTTPATSLVVALPRTCTAPDWTTWISFRLNYTLNCLSGSTSYAQADASDAVTAVWTNSSGPSTPTIATPTTLTTNVSALTTIGLYTFHLVVTAVSGGGTAPADLAVGAVAMTDDGTVIPDLEATTKIFGPMLAFGRNPWGYADERQYIGSVLGQIANNTYYTGDASIWSVAGTGTVAYPFAGIGPAPGQTGATLNGGITSSATTINISTSQNLPSLATLSTCPTTTNPPIALLIGNSLGSQEMVRIACTSATTGNAALTVAYDGRGIASTPWGNGAVVAAQSWSNGVTVGEFRIAGTSTLFATDTNRPLCPAGVPGPVGPVTYSTGTVRLAASSATVTGSGTTWNTGNGVQATYMIRVAATHASGTPFIWWAQITTVGGTTSITASRPAPADVDTGTDFAYKILGPRYTSLEFSSPTWGGTQRLLQNVMYCESETNAFGTPAHDITVLDSTNVSGVHYSYKNTLGCCSAFGPNFYGTGLALRQFYLRSGYTPALTAANLIDNYWVRDPEVGSGYGIGSPLFYGGGYQGGLANWATNPSSLLSFTDFRQWASIGNGYLVGHPVCNNSEFDTRDQAYYQLFLSMAAIFDPDGTLQTTWLNDLGASGSGWLQHDQSCKRADNSWAVPLMTDIHGTFTNGSAVVTGTGFDSVGTGHICMGTASGTITVTHGSTAATLISGSLGTLATNFNIAIWDNVSSPNYVGFLEFTFTGSAVTLAAAWPGASGTFSFVVQDINENGAGAGGITAIGAKDYTDDDNIRQTEGWACTYNSPTQITLNRPWNDAVTGGSLHASGTYSIYPAANYGVGPAGYFQQPFTLGIKTKVMSYLGAYSGNSTLMTGYTTLAGLAGGWFNTTGFDTNTSGSYYARIQGTCEPFLVANSVTLFYSIHGAFNLTPCGYSGLKDPTISNAEYTERVNSAEALGSAVGYYQQQCAISTSACNSARTFVDLVYGAIYGKPSLTTDGYYSDTHYVTGELSDVSLGAYKWTGFFFGVGGLSNWPAIRLSSPVVATPTFLLIGNNLKSRGIRRP